jgi:ATP-dependent protease ClpP protease subunit
MGALHAAALGMSGWSNAPAPLRQRFADRADELLRLKHVHPNQLSAALSGLGICDPCHEAGVKEFSQIFAECTIGGSLQSHPDVLTIRLGHEILDLPDSLAERIRTAQQVIVEIDSIGGNSNAGWMLIDALAGKDVLVRIGSVAASTAAIVAQAGRHRTIRADGFIGLHPLFVAVMAHAAQLRHYAGELERSEVRAVDFLQARTKQPRETVEAWLSGPDVWFNASQALHYNLVDEIIPCPTPQT